MSDPSCTDAQADSGELVDSSDAAPSAASAAPKEGKQTSAKPKGPSVATKLTALGKACCVALFADECKIAYAIVVVNGKEECMAIRERAFRSWLLREYYLAYGTTPSGTARADAIGALEAMALYDGEVRSVAVRSGKHGGKAYLDLADEQRRVVEVSAQGWAVMPNAPIPLVRPHGSGPLPEPIRGGSIEELWEYVNIVEPGDRQLLATWVSFALVSEGPFPILVLQGEQGSAKTSIARALRALIDPRSPPTRSLPKDERDLAIAARNSRLLVYDNQSGILPHMSDCLCRLATGGGFATRALYSDGEETLFDYRRPLIVNGIDDLTARPDLAERAIVLWPPRLLAAKRRDEAQLWSSFDSAAPRILGALLDAVVIGLARLPETKLERLPRMADFAIWAAAVEPGFGYAPGSTLRAYAGNASARIEAAIEASTIATAVEDLMRDVESWHGTATQLLSQLDAVAGPRGRRADDWPKRAAFLTNGLRRVAPFLRERGLDVSFEQRSARRRPITITHAKVTAEASSSPSSDEFGVGDVRDGGTKA